MLAKIILNKICIFLTLGGVILTSVLIISEPTVADHRTNKPNVQRSLENGWIVIYSKEFSHEEYLKLSSAIAADALGGSGSVTSAYFSNFADESRTKILQEVVLKAPSIIDEITRELTIQKILSAIKVSFNGSNSVNFSIAGMEFEIGRATYNREECARIKECAVPRMGQTGCRKWISTFWGSRECIAPTFGQVGCDKWVETSTRCIPTPNTYQPYIRFRVARNNSVSSTNATNSNSSVCVSVDSTKGWQRFNLPGNFTKITSLGGGWSVDTRSYQPVNASGHGGSDAQALTPYNQYKFDQRFPFGALLMASSQGALWIQAPTSLNSPFNAVDMRINDADNALSDNGGLLQVCFGR